jgi:EEF1A lysine methyltransferase 4
MGSTLRYCRDARYQSEGPNASFDWFKTYTQIRDILLDVIPNRSSKILILGCGNSSLSEDMYLDGFEDITNVDVRYVDM